MLCYAVCAAPVAACLQGPIWRQLDLLLDGSPECAPGRLERSKEACQSVQQERDTAQQERDNLQLANSSLQAQLTECQAQVRQLQQQVAQLQAAAQQ